MCSHNMIMRCAAVYFQDITYYGAEIPLYVLMGIIGQCYVYVHVMGIMDQCYVYVHVMGIINILII